MSNAAAIILVLVALITVGAVVVVLFSGSDDPEIDLEPIIRENSTPSSDRTVTASINGKPDVKETNRPDREKVAIEDIKPKSNWMWRPVEVAVRVLSLPGLKAVPADRTTFNVYLNDVPIPCSPAPTGRPGEVTFGRLLPGRYRFEAATDDSREGFLTLKVEANLGYKNNLYVAEPTPFEIKVVSAKSKHPISSAMVNATDLISRGLTDERGIFRSKRPIAPDPDMQVTVSKNGYFTTLFRPFSEKQVRGSKKSTRVIALKPLKGASRLSGTLVDQDGRPLNRWSLRLIPAGARPTGPGAISFYETISNHRGEFTFKELLGGDYILEGAVQNWVAGGKDYIPLFTESISIGNAEVVEDRQIVCRLRPIQLKGIVLRADTMEPVTGVTVSTGGRQGNFLKDVVDFDDVVTDSAGLFCIEDPFLPTQIGTLLQRTGLHVKPRGGEVEIFRIQQGSTSMNSLIADLVRQVPITIWLHYSGTSELSGVVTDASGNPIKGVIVEAVPLFGFDRQRYRALSNANGHFTLRKLFTGRWNVSASFPSGPSIHQPVTISPDSASEQLNFQAPGSCRLEGRVDLDESGYFPRISIRGENFRLDDSRLRKSGVFHFDHLPAGKVTVVVESYSTQRFEEQSLIIRKAEVELLDRTTVTVNL